MSDEPKKRSRGWIGWAVLAALVLYPLSMGPAWRCALTSEDWPSNEDRVNTAYAPICWLCERQEWAANAMRRYINLWDPLYVNAWDPKNPHH
jgi:hypothetical protein